jgi:hypothetical protein
MQLNKQLTTQYFNFIKQAGYEYSKDDLGYYFDSGLKKFSIMKTGSMFECYYNVKQSNGGWGLKDKQLGIFDFVQGLRWVLTKIQQGK